MEQRGTIQGREGVDSRQLTVGGGEEREILVDVPALPSQLLSLFDLRENTQIGMQLALLADQGGEHQPGGTEGGEQGGMLGERQLVQALAGGEHAGDEDAQEVNLAGEVGGLGGIEHADLLRGEVGAVEGHGSSGGGLMADSWR